MLFKKAVKRDAKLRLALCGPAGSGKTYSLLSLATELGGPIAYVDTEHGSASKYADLFSFDVIEPDEFDPRNLIETIKSAIEGGYKVICIDSLSHYWMGKGGELDMVDAAAKRTQGNSFAAWKHVTPVHNQLVDTMISASIHVLVSMRTKTEWVVEKDERTGKSAPRKVGLQPVMRDGVEYEFDVCGDLDQDNTLTVTKSRCPDLSGKTINRPGKDMAQTLKKWLSGAPEESGRGPMPEKGNGAATPPLARPVPEELTLTFQRMDKNDSAAVGQAFIAMEQWLTEKGGANGVKAYNAAVTKLRAAHPKGSLIPNEALKECLLDLWDELQKVQKPEGFASHTTHDDAKGERTAVSGPTGRPAGDTRQAPPPNPTSEVPPEVQKLWSKMGTNRESIIDVFADLVDGLQKVAGNEKGREEFEGIEIKFAGKKGGALTQVSFARRVVLETWKRIQAYKTQANPNVTDDDLPPIMQPAESRLFPQEVPYGD